MHYIEIIDNITQSFLDGRLSRVNLYIELEMAVKNHLQAGGEKLYVMDLILTDRSSEEEIFRKQCNDLMVWCKKIKASTDTREWILQEIVEDEAYFNFFDESGQSKLNAHKTLYKTNIEFSSFLMSSLSGTIKPARFSHERLIEVLREIEGNDLAAWAHCIEVDGVHAHIDIYNGSIIQPLNDTIYWRSAYENYQYEMNIIERTAMIDYQSNTSYYALIPSSKKWALVHAYFGDSFEIILHGNSDFLSSVSKRIEF